MASELRVNSSTNRSGLGTITYTDSGPIVSGVGTFTNGFTVDGTQTTVKSLKLTGDNYNANWFKTSSTFRLNDNAKLNIGSADDMQQYHDGTTSYIKNTTGVLRIENTVSNIGLYASHSSGDIIMRAGGATSSENAIVAVSHGEVTLGFNGSTKLTTTNTGAVVSGILTATTFVGNGDFVDIDVDGHTNLDNVSIVGITTVTGSSQINFGSGTTQLQISNSNDSDINHNESNGSGLRLRINGQTQMVVKTDTITYATNLRNYYTDRIATHSGDVDTEIRFPANDTISFDTAGSERLRIDSSGRVLIGSTALAGDSALQVYTSDDLHPAIRTNSASNNGYTMFGDAYKVGESQVNIGISHSSASLVLSQGCKVNTSNDDAYVSSQGTYSTRPNVLRLDTDGSLSYHSREASATTPTDNAVTLTELFKVDRVGNIYQRISGRNMYFGASNQLRIGVQHNGDPNIEAVSGDLKLMKNGSSIMQLRSDGFEMKQDIYFGTAGKGIVLGNTSNVDANTLDDYEEGTFSPYYIDGQNTQFSQHTSGFAYGEYVKIGKLVYFTCGVRCSGYDRTPSGRVFLHNLPFVSKNYSDDDEPIFSMQSRLWGSGNPPKLARMRQGTGGTGRNDIALQMGAHLATNETPLQGSDFDTSATCRVVISGHYMVP